MIRNILSFSSLNNALYLNLKNLLEFFIFKSSNKITPKIHKNFNQTTLFQVFDIIWLKNAHHVPLKNASTTMHQTIEHLRDFITSQTHLKHNHQQSIIDTYSKNVFLYKFFIIRDHSAPILFWCNFILSVLLFYIHSFTSCPCCIKFKLFFLTKVIINNALCTVNNTLVEWFHKLTRTRSSFSNNKIIFRCTPDCAMRW